ncbi:hypothetical protein A3D88_01885 [Candidatus Peribacteria bacterium RIFCSPHIGHO2_02_FULL_52_16]|nr:MAG: hypothetical protein A2706_05080 [Candidatus Peribacteria bacterium RIFCSPHIGHO2_01_FULL_51_35]OGJ61137.1 MAG: hypothetical protein A3D88_01885 [Candidatus Peribacteria bacterium RIFCSPHIGHO2_02_FULL_52_16]
MYDLDPKEFRILRSLNTPVKIQDFLGELHMNFADTCLSPRRVLRERKAHCMEGAMLAAAALRLSGRKPWVLDLKSFPSDDDHVVAVFREDACWGALSKTNHGVLRYREPVYKTIRELVMSYFHEYFLNDGKKTLRSFTNPIDLSRLDKKGWMTAEEDLWYVPKYIDSIKHFPILTRAQLSRLRKADPIERKMGKIVEWTRSRKKN